MFYQTQNFSKKYTKDNFRAHKCNKLPNCFVKYKIWDFVVILWVVGVHLLVLICDTESIDSGLKSAVGWCHRACLNYPDINVGIRLDVWLAAGSASQRTTPKSTGGAGQRAVTESHCSLLRADWKLSDQQSCDYFVLVLGAGGGKLHHRFNAATWK